MFQIELNMVVADIAKIEEQIRNKALTKGIRTNEFFYDYDALRSGYVTGNFVFLNKILDWAYRSLTNYSRENTCMVFVYSNNDV